MKAKVWTELGGGARFSVTASLIHGPPVAASTVFPGTSLGAAKEEQLDHLISLFPEQGPSHLCSLPSE